MKKMFTVMIVIAMAVAACGKKKAPEAPKGDMGSAAPATAPAGDGSAAPAGGETPPPAN
jgi:predicted small lipoprotein YifL